jgi:hypothetical protein
VAAATTRAIRSSAALVAAAVASDSLPDGTKRPSSDATDGTKRSSWDAADGTAASQQSQDSARGPITGRRLPTAAESRQAASLTQRLNSAALRGRATVTTPSMLPPGRLDMRSVLARDAQKAAGATPTATPWQRTIRKTIPSPPLRVGIAVDVSGSMRAFAGPSSSTAWILAQATRGAGLDALSATAAFGGTIVTSITQPGRAPAHVTELSADAVGHPVADAIDLLDHSLSLARPGAARLLVIVSDGRFRPDERTSAQARIDHLRGAGCALLWIATPQQNPQPLTGAELAIVSDPATVGAVIGNAAVKALTN